MKIEDLIEHEDGSATVQVEMDLDEVQKLLEFALYIAFTDSAIDAVKQSKLKELKDLDETTD
jgi:hypothetical protein